MNVDRDVFTVIVGGKAGQGVRKAGNVIVNMFNEMGRYAFQMDEYPSLIKGGHNFSVVSTSIEEIKSHYPKANLVVALDGRSYIVHRNSVAEGGVMVLDSKVDGDGVKIPIMDEASKYPNSELLSGLSSVAILCAVLGMKKERLYSVVKQNYVKGLEDNLAYAGTIYEVARKEIGIRFGLKEGDGKRVVLTGNEAIALGAYMAGLDVYIAYPMTPSTSILHFFARNSSRLGIAVMQAENEIAVANMAIGSAFTGARTMVGTSGGGFALMEEAFSMTGMAEVPLLFVLSSRPGPSTGVPTYTEQGDLYFALNQGHGEFPRIVASPGSIEEAFYLAGELLNLAWHFQTPAVLVCDKHISESRATVSIETSKVKEELPLLHRGNGYKRYLITDDGISPMHFLPSREMIKWNSYEHDENGITTESGEMIVKMHDKRNRKQDSIINYLKKVHSVNVYGSGSNVVFAFGSATMSIVEAINAFDLDVRVVQPIYLEPLPIWELRRYRRSKAMVVEQNSTGQFARLLKEKAGIESQSLRKYNGRPFDVEELAYEIRRWLHE